jgi:hypothetical protein
MVPLALPPRPGSTNRPCAEGFACQDDAACIPGPAEADCSGTCIPVCSTLTGERCAEGFACTINPAVTCPAMPGFDCPGLCVQTCGGLVAGPSQQCPDGTSCVDNPLQPNCTLAADCPGVCLPSSNPESCSTLTGQGCGEGYACAPDPDIACIALAGFDCPGQCVQSCGGRTVSGQSRDCPGGTSCVNNPSRPDCDLAADCPGVCLSVYNFTHCSTLSGEGCPDGYACTFNTAYPCREIEDAFDCIGYCAPSCGGFRVGSLPDCPDGTICVDNPAQPECSLAFDCPGVCLERKPKITCTGARRSECPDGMKCVDDPDGAGMCV